MQHNHAKPYYYGNVKLDQRRIYQLFLQLDRTLWHHVSDSSRYFLFPLSSSKLFDYRAPHSHDKDVMTAQSD